MKDEQPAVSTYPSPEPTDISAGERAYRLRQQELLTRFGRLALETRDFMVLLQEATRLCAEGLNTRFCKAMEYLPDEDQFVVRASVGFRPDVVGSRTGADLDSPTGYAFRRSEPVISSHLDDKDRFRTPQILAEHGIKRAINVPIVTTGEHYGVLEVDSTIGSRFTEADITFVQGFANLLGVALERVRDEAALHETKERYRMAARATNDVIWDWDFASNRIFWSEALATLFGYAEVATAPSWWKDHIHPDDRERVVASIEDVIASDHENWSAEYRFLRADGSEANVFDRGFVRRDAQRRAVRMIGSMLDQTERRRTEEARRRSEERLRTAFAISTVGVMFWDKDFALTEVNDAFLCMTGFSRAEALGKTWQELTPEEFHPASWRAVEEVTTLGEATPYEKQYFRKDGSRWWGLFAPREVGDEVVEFALDITDRKEAEEALRRLNEELERRIATAVAERERTEAVLRQSQKLEAVGQLTGGVAHDFNNLLTIIRSSIDFLRRPNLPEERRSRYIEAISDTVDRASKLTGQLLAFARRQALKPEVFDVPERIRAIADMLRTIVGARIQIITELACERCRVEADVTQFETALVNMAVNARDAMNGEGTLKVHVRALSRMPSIRGHAGGPGRYVAVSVGDTGCGIPPERLGQIFEPFFTTKEVGKGTGLGLSQVYGFAKQSGGDIAVESDVGVGTTFTLYLPRTEGDVALESGDDDRASASDEEGRGCRVLVVEDNIAVGRFSTQLLQDLGYETTWAANAGEALGLLDEDAGRFDVVFSDVVMPGMSGVDLGREIRRRYPGVPVVLTSGYSHVLAEEGRHGFELLHKPYAVDDVSRVLRRVTRGLGAAQAHAAGSGRSPELS
ncbi:PAS domain S-box protein [Microvirga sp. TS319]|uniref:PAS domain S-box protein n=1 Tax=Microvirga sp. TS319 TaxID=3241165 RepID=UPI00351A56E7